MRRDERPRLEHELVPVPQPQRPRVAAYAQAIPKEGDPSGMPHTAKRLPRRAARSKCTTPVGVFVQVCARQCAPRMPTRAGMTMAKPFANSSRWTRRTGVPGTAQGACMAGGGW